MIAGWQGPNAVQVIGQHDKRVNVKWPPRFRTLHGGAEGRDFGDERVRAAVVQADREEIGPARYTVAAVVRHDGSMGVAFMRKVRGVGRDLSRRPPSGQRTGASAAPAGMVG